MLSRGSPRCSSPMTSLSANTVHIELTVAASFEARAASPSSSISQPSALAITSRKRPVPAAHLSFISKSSTRPAGPRRITLVSWPPMSRIERTSGKRRVAPSA